MDDSSLQSATLYPFVDSVVSLLLHCSLLILQSLLSSSTSSVSNTLIFLLMIWECELGIGDLDLEFDASDDADEDEHFLGDLCKEFTASEPQFDDILFLPSPL